MLKKRVVILLTLVNGQLYRSKRFRADRWYTLNFVDLESADEVVMLDITPGGNREAFRETVCRFGDECFVPLAVGGGIKNFEDVRWCLNEMPCEKVVVGRHARKVFNESAGRVGIQSLVFGLAPGYGGDYPEYGTFGEILFQNMDYDGSLEGYDLDGLAHVVGAFNGPIVVGSGCGAWSHMVEGFKHGADGCATSCIFHFTPQALAACKSHLKDEGIPVRA